MAELWISADELMAVAKWSPRTLRRKARGGEIKWRTSNARAANGRRQRAYLQSSLPEDLQKGIVRRHAAIGRRDRAGAAKEITQLVSFRREPAPKDTPRIVLPDPKTQAQAEHRLRAIEPLLDYLKWTTPAEREQWCAQNGFTAKNADDLARQIASKENCTSRTVWRWVKRFRGNGFPALADRIRADKGQSRWFEAHPKAKMFAAYLYLNERTSISYVWERIQCEIEMLGLAPDDAPSRETVRLFLSRSVSPAMETLARDGAREYHERMAPYLKRGYVDVYANQVWVGDHCIHDREIQNDIFEEVPLGTPGRLRNSTFIDYRSRYAWSTFAWEGSSRSIAATMLRAMLEVGPPEQIYVDNGKDYKKVAKGATHASEAPALIDDEKAPRNWWENEYQSIERTGLLSRLGISVTHCIPRHPQSKGVERFFRTMHMRFDALGSTYTSGSPFTRPELAEKLMMRHRRLLKAGRVADSTHPTASQFIADYLAWLKEYNETPQRGEGMDGCSPREVFEANLNPKQKPAPPAESLALLLAERVPRKVRECSVRLNNYRYLPRPEDRAAWGAMHEANEQEVVVAYNSDDPEFAVALTLDGRFLAWLEAEALLRFAPGDADTRRQIAESMQTRRGLEKATRQTLGLIAATARANGAMSPEESLRSRHGLAGTPGVITQRKPRLTSGRKVAAPMTPTEVAQMILEMKEDAS
ncbi:MAG: helix-turn-helix domain-containing protein [Terracidiphilus sp.]|jgi:hypothetical protein